MKFKFVLLATVCAFIHIGSDIYITSFCNQEIHEGLQFSSNSYDYDDYSFGIFSVKFSTDGREIVAASSDESIYVYDLEARRLSLKIPAHMVIIMHLCS